MNKNTVVNFKKPSEFLPDSSTDVLRAGARELLATAVRAEVSEFPACHVQLMEDECHQRFVRHSFLRVPEVLTGIGKVAIMPLIYVGQKGSLSTFGKYVRSKDRHP